MAIVGDHPAAAYGSCSSGRSKPEAPWVYRGAAFTPDARFALEVHVSAEGERPRRAGRGRPGGARREGSPPLSHALPAIRETPRAARRPGRSSAGGASNHEVPSRIASAVRGTVSDRRMLFESVASSRRAGVDSSPLVACAALSGVPSRLLGCERRAEDRARLHRRRQARVRGGDGGVHRPQLDRRDDEDARGEAQVQLLQVRPPRRAPDRRLRLQAGEVRRRDPGVSPVRPRPPLGRRGGLLRPVEDRRGRVRADQRLDHPRGRRGARPGRRLRRLQGAARLPPRLPRGEGEQAHARSPRRRHRAARPPRALRRPLLPAARQLRRGRHAHPVRAAQLRSWPRAQRGVVAGERRRGSSPRRCFSSARRT